MSGAPSLQVLEIESDEADAIVAELGGEVIRSHAGGAWIGARDEVEVRVSHGVRPLASASELAAEIASSSGAEITARESLVTSDGELAALAVMASEARQQVAGFVLAEDHYSRVVTSFRRPEAFDLFVRLGRAAARGCGLGLGARRRRQPLYQEPPGWFGVRRRCSTGWYAPGFPRAHAVIVVDDSSDELDLERALLRAAAKSSIGLDRGSRRGVSLRTAGGLRGRIDHYDDPAGDHVVEVVALLDDRFLYSALMESDRSSLPECRAVFEQVVESMVGLPHPSRGRP